MLEEGTVGSVWCSSKVSSSSDDVEMKLHLRKICVGISETEKDLLETVKKMTRNPM
jgi:hypothetical protein